MVYPTQKILRLFYYIIKSKNVNKNTIKSDEAMQNYAFCYAFCIDKAKNIYLILLFFLIRLTNLEK